MVRYLPPFGIIPILIDLLSLLSLLILVEVIVSWAIYFGARGISRYHPWVRMLHRVTDPILMPFRKILPPERMQGLDISPLLAIIIIQIVQQILWSAAVSSMR